MYVVAEIDVAPCLVFLPHYKDRGLELHFQIKNFIWIFQTNVLSLYQFFEGIVT